MQKDLDTFTALVRGIDAIDGLPGGEWALERSPVSVVTGQAIGALSGIPVMKPAQPGRRSLAGGRLRPCGGLTLA